MASLRVKYDRLLEMNEEYRELVGEKVLGHISDPSDHSNPRQYRFAFQGDTGVVIGIDEAFTAMERLLDRAREGYTWDDSPIPEFKKTWGL